jgi:F-type H+-transporting ATPase subunit delta
VAFNEIARMYAGALLGIGQEKGILTQVEEELKQVAGIISGDKDMMMYLKSPKISREDKKGMIDKIFAGKIADVMVNFLKVLIDKDRQMLIKDIDESFAEFMDQANNRQRVRVVASTELDGGVVDRIKAALKDKFKKEIIMDITVNKSILGGIIIKIGDLIIDGSLSKSLSKVRGRLLYSKIRSESAYED